jgi:hypothetical protein
MKTSRREPDMWPKKIVVSAVILLVMLGISFSSAMTQEEAIKKIQEWGIEETAHKIVALDAILSAVPKVDLLPTLYVLDGRDLVAAGGMALVTVPPYLEYTLTFEPQRVKDFAPGDRSFEVCWWRIITVVGFAAGVGVGLLVHK